jgi:integrase
MSNGCRPLTPEEVDTLRDYFTSAPFHKHLERDRVFVYLSLQTGWRCSEIIQIKVSDVYDPIRKRVLDRVNVAKNAVKCKTTGKSAILTPDIKNLIIHYITHYVTLGREKPVIYLFESPQGGHLGYRQALRICHKHFEQAGLDPSNLSTHTYRKTFADRVYKALDNDLIALQHALSHKSVSSTSAYIRVDKEKVENVLNKLSFV